MSEFAYSDEVKYLELQKSLTVLYFSSLELASVCKGTFPEAASYCMEYFKDITFDNPQYLQTVEN